MMSPWWHPISVQWISVCHWFSLSHYISSMSGHHFFVYSQHMSVISVISQWYRHVSPCFATAQMGPARIIRLCYEVKTAVDLTEQLALGPAMRSLQPGEILEAQDIVTSLSFQCRFGVGTRGRELADICHVCWDMLSSDGASQDVGYVGCWSWDVEMLRCWDVGCGELGCGWLRSGFLECSASKTKTSTAEKRVSEYLVGLVKWYSDSTINMSAHDPLRNKPCLALELGASEASVVFLNRPYFQKDPAFQVQAGPRSEPSTEVRIGKWLVDWPGG